LQKPGGYHIIESKGEAKRRKARGGSNISENQGGGAHGEPHELFGQKKLLLPGWCGGNTRHLNQFDV